MNTKLLILVIALLTIPLAIATSYTVSSYPRSVNDNASIGITAWINPHNIENATGGITTYDYILGTFYEHDIRIVKSDGSLVPVNLSTGAQTPPASYATVTYGNSNYLWGSTWTPADINNANFGAAFAAGNDSGSHYLWANNYNFSIPTNATINGITLNVQSEHVGGGTHKVSVKYMNLTIDYSDGAVLTGNLSVNASTGGTATGRNSTFTPPANLTINATPSGGYTFNTWTTNCNGTIANTANANTTILVNDITACYATASFNSTPTAAINPPFTLSGTGTLTIKGNGVFTITQ